MTAVLAPVAVGHSAARTMRVSWRLSPNATLAACTVLRSGCAAVLEVRARHARAGYAVPGLGPHSQLVPADDGTVAMCHHRDGVHLVERLGADGGITPLARSSARGFVLIDGTHAVELDAQGFSRLLRVTSDGVVPIAVLPGAVVGAVALDDTASRLALNIIADGRRCSASVLDTATGALEDFVSVSAESDDRVLDYLAAANLLVVSTDATGETRLGIGRPGAEPIRFPAAMAADGPVSHLATSADGRVVAVAVDAGAVSRIRLVDPATGTARELDLPPLVVVGRGGIADGELVVPVSTPDRPATLLHIVLASGDFRFDDPPIGTGTGYRLARFPGGDGDIEAIVVGDPATAETVVIALHGGPLAAWRAMFDPLLAGLAAAGIAVVAPNVRGSTGYGRSHSLAIRDHWGGPDRDDVLAVGASVSRARPSDAQPPVLLGMSYGAYLAVLAATSAPARWSGCIALAPFVSGARVAAAAGPVAELVRRLGGTTSPDLRDDLAELAVPLLLMHGVHDDVIPIAESQLLAAALARHDRPHRFAPIADGGHDLLGFAHRGAVIESIVSFCQGHHGPPETPQTTSAHEGRD